MQDPTVKHVSDVGILDNNLITFQFYESEKLKSCDLFCVLIRV